jgi:hypothetical protein
MRLLSPTRKLCVLPGAPYLCASPSNQFLLPASSTTVFAILFCHTQFPRRGADNPVVDRGLHPLRNWDRPDVATFSPQVSDEPMSLTRAAPAALIRAKAAPVVKRCITFISESPSFMVLPISSRPHFRVARFFSSPDSQRRQKHTVLGGQRQLVRALARNHE